MRVDGLVRGFESRSGSCTAHATFHNYDGSENSLVTQGPASCDCVAVTSSLQTFRRNLVADQTIQTRVIA